MGSGLSVGGASPKVYTLAISGTILYAGGYFNAAGGVSAHGIAQWNGSSWSALGPGNGTILALAVSGTNLYAGGGGIAQWNGSSWAALGSGVSGGGVSALAVSGTNLYVGGDFTMAGNKISAYLAEAILDEDSTNTPPVIVTTNSDFGFSNGSNQFGFDVAASGPAGQTLVIQGSTNLVDWVPLQTNVLGSLPWYFSDSYSSNFTQRFYRAQLLP